MKPVLTFFASLLLCLGPTLPAFGADIPPAAKELVPDIQRLDARVFADPVWSKNSKRPMLKDL
jgi:hypothetical protein